MGPRPSLRELPHAFDDAPGHVFLDIAYQVHVPEALRLFFFHGGFDGVDQFPEQTVVELTHTLLPLAFLVPEKGGPL